MRYDTGTIIVAAPSQSAARDAMLQYGVCDISGYSNDTGVTVIPTIRIVTTYAEGAALTDPSDTKWSALWGYPVSLDGLMRVKYGPPMTLAECIRAMNTDVAINPKLLSL